MAGTTLDLMTADLTAAMKARDQVATSTLRQAIAAVRGEAKAGPVARELSEQDVLAVLTREVKKRRESAQIYTDAGHPDRAAAETAEADFIATYLPTPLTEQEAAALVADVITELGATTLRDLGAVMKTASAKAAGRTDGRTLSTLARAALTN